MTHEELLQVESSARQHNEVMLNQSRLAYTIEQEELGRFNLLRPKIFIDGDQWCCLYGDDIQTGIAGFGSTPDKAIWDWNLQWNKEITKESKQ